MTTLEKRLAALQYGQSNVINQGKVIAVARKDSLQVARPVYGLNNQQERMILVDES